MISDHYKKTLDTYGLSLKAVYDSHEMVMLISTAPDVLKVHTGPAYLCPLCLAHFFCIRDEEYYQNEDFSWDHFPPESVGGKSAVLVCTPCNSFFGREIDFALKKYLHFQNFLQKKDTARYPVRVNYNGVPGNYKIEMMWEGEKLVYAVPFKSYPLVRQWMLNPNPNMSFTQQISGPAQNLISRALLKAAYLKCFEQLGYDFILSHTGRKLSGCIRGTEKHPLPTFGVFGDVHENNLDGLYQLTTRKGLKSLVVFMSIIVDEPSYNQKAFVLIPYRTEGHWNQLEEFLPWIDKKQADMTLSSMNTDYVRKGDYFAYSRVSLS